MTLVLPPVVLTVPCSVHTVRVLSPVEVILVDVEEAVRSAQPDMRNDDARTGTIIVGTSEKFLIWLRWEVPCRDSEQILDEKS